MGKVLKFPDPNERQEKPHPTIEQCEADIYWLPSVLNVRLVADNGNIVPPPDRAS